MDGSCAASYSRFGCGDGFDAQGGIAVIIYVVLKTIKDYHGWQYINIADVGCRRCPGHYLGTLGIYTYIYVICI